MLDLTPGAPLGGFPYGSCPEQEFSLSTGETVVLYTDGLVERRGIALTETIEQLASILGAARTAERACQLAVDEMVPPEGLADDVAIVAMQSTADPERFCTWTSPPIRVCSRGCRRLLRRWLREHGAEEPILSEVALAANEAAPTRSSTPIRPGPGIVPAASVD